MTVDDSTDCHRPLFPGVDRSFAIPLLVLVVLAAVANSLGASYFWRSSFTAFDQFLLCAALGGLVAQPSLVAVWWATSSQSVTLRSIYCLSLMFVLFSAYIITVNYVNKTSEIDLPIVFSLVALGIFAITAIPLVIASRKIGFRIGRLSKTEAGRAKSQITIRQLFVIVTVASLVCVVAPMCFPARDIQNSPLPWRAITTFLLAFIFSVAVSTIVSVLHVYSKKRLKYINAAVLGYLLLMPIIVFAYLKHHAAFAITGPITLSGVEILLLIYTFFITLYVVNAIVLWGSRGLGYGFTLPSRY